MPYLLFLKKRKKLKLSSAIETIGGALWVKLFLEHLKFCAEMSVCSVISTTTIETIYAMVC